MKSWLWLIVTALLFAGWIGWLAYRVYELKQEPWEKIWVEGKEKDAPVVLSRPQFLVASLVVTAEVEGKEGRPTTAKVVEVHWPVNDETRKLEGQTIPVKELAGSMGLTAAGSYLIPLMRSPDGYRVTPTPPSPGYRPGPPHIYPSTPSTREQLEQIRQKWQLP